MYLQKAQQATQVAPGGERREASVEPAGCWKLLLLGAAVSKRPRPMASGDERYPEETLMAFY